MCEKRFNRHSNVKSHLRIHMEKRGLSCYECSRKFTHRTGVSRHPLCTVEIDFFSRLRKTICLQHTGLNVHLRIHNRTLVCSEHGYLKGHPNTNSKWKNLLLSIQCSPQRTSISPNSKPRWGTRQEQAIAKTPAKWSSYKIPSVIIVFVILVSKVSLVSFIPKSHKRPWT
jgi:hypothetical protein